mmetsp:Transcript_6988/g.10377  ORF Transcript_6988/g.10377 Transcript_6988/m.10377 type:complete len:275 (-) Transcript_6988:410-1234(-)
MLLDQSDLCFERAAECLVRLTEFEEARSLFEKLATSCVGSNLRRFNAKLFLLKAILCAMAEKIDITVEDCKAKMEEKQKNTSKHSTQFKDPDDDESVDVIDYRTNSQRKYDAIYNLCEDDYIRMDLLWKGSVERKFIKNLLAAREKCDHHDFIDHVYYFQSIRPVEQILIQLLKVPFEEIPHEMEVKKFMEEQRRKEAERQYYLDLLASSGSLAQMQKSDSMHNTSMGKSSDGDMSAKISMQKNQKKPISEPENVGRQSINSDATPTNQRVSFA